MLRHVESQYAMFDTMQLQRTLYPELTHVEGVGTPGAKSHDEKKPVFGAELGQKTEGILQGFGLLPFCIILAIVVRNDNALFPNEEVTPRLFGCSDGALGERVRGLVGASHSEDQW
jgi:hypothetical protein